MEKKERPNFGNKIKGLLLDCNYTIDEKGMAIIEIFVGTEKEIIKFEDHEFRPYFYAISKEPEKSAKAISEHAFADGVKALRAEHIKKSNSDGCVKVEFRNP